MSDSNDAELSYLEFDPEKDRRLCAAKGCENQGLYQFDYEGEDAFVRSVMLCPQHFALAKRLDKRL